MFPSLLVTWKHFCKEDWFPQGFKWWLVEGLVCWEWEGCSVWDSQEAGWNDGLVKKMRFKYILTRKRVYRRARREWGSLKCSDRNLKLRWWSWFLVNRIIWCSCSSVWKDLTSVRKKKLCVLFCFDFHILLGAIWHFLEYIIVSKTVTYSLRWPALI